MLSRTTGQICWNRVVKSAPLAVLHFLGIPVYSSLQEHVEECQVSKLPQVPLMRSFEALSTRSTKRNTKSTATSRLSIEVGGRGIAKVGSSSGPGVLDLNCLPDTRVFQVLLPLCRIDLPPVLSLFSLYTWPPSLTFPV